MADVNPFTFSAIGGLQNVIEGPILASATTIAPTFPVHHVSGTVAVVNITLPATDYAGTIALVPDGVFTWTSAGNIAIAGTAVVNKTLFMTYCKSVSKWTPSYLS